MMDCPEFEDLLVTQVYGRRIQSHIDELMSHLEACSECAERYTHIVRTRNRFVLKTKAIDPDWERSWGIIREDVVPRKRAHDRLGRLPRFAYAAAAVIVVFMVGLFAGRHIFRLKKGSDLAGAQRIDGQILSLDAFADKLEFVLINFMNRTPSPEDADKDAYEERIISDMLGQTRLLKNLWGQNADPRLRALLNEIECLLMSIVNLKSGDTQSADYLEKHIREKALNHQLRQLLQENIAI